MDIGNLKDTIDKEDSWNSWDMFRQICNYPSKLHVVLELEEELDEVDESEGQESAHSSGPANSTALGTGSSRADLILRRWLGEPVRAVVIPTKLFLLNKSGFPVLPRLHQRIVHAFYAHKVQIILKGKPNFPEHAVGTYVEYLRHLNHKLKLGGGHRPEAGGGGDRAGEDAVTAAYRDCLQAPLQPLMDNLESGRCGVSSDTPPSVSPPRLTICT